MTVETHERLFGVRTAFDTGLVEGLTIVVASILIVTPIVFAVLSKAGKLNEKLRRELWDRYISWLILAPLIIGPILLGAFATMLAVCALSLLCYREFARATGLFRERAISLVVVLGILCITYACLDNWYGFFAALSPLTVGVIAVITIFYDQPKGFIQRVGLGVLAFMLFGVCFGHLGFFCNDERYRGIVCWLLLCVELNDVFAYICGKSFGHIKLAPRTSPNKTVGGALGALVLTTILGAVLAHLVFAGTIVANWDHALTLGLIISVVGQLGDLLISSVKRDIGIKDMGTTLPGHGGILDRFNSLLLVCPAVFHYVGYYLGVGLGSEMRIFSKGFFG